MSYIHNINFELPELENFSYDKEYKKKYNFIMENSYSLTLDYILGSESSVNRKEALMKIDSYVKVINLSEEIETGIFEFSLNYIKQHGYDDSHYEQIYQHKLDDICLNLDVTNKRINNKTLLKNLLENVFSGQIIAFLNMYQIHPTRWKNIIDKTDLRDKTLFTVNTTDEFRCARCGERKHVFFITQTRSADEPATVFYTCTVCKRTFTKSL